MFRAFIKQILSNKMLDQNKTPATYKLTYHFKMTMCTPLKSLIPYVKIMVPRLGSLYIVFTRYLRPYKSTHTIHNITHSLDLQNSTSIYTMCLTY